MAALASLYHFPPESLWAMEVDDLHFWLDGASELRKRS